MPLTTMRSPGGVLVPVRQVGARQTGNPAGINPFSAGLLAYYPFDDGAGVNVRDASGNGNGGVWQGTLGSQWGANLGPAKSGVFNGTDNSVAFPRLFSSPYPSLSVSVWIKIPVPQIGGFFDIGAADGTSGGMYFAVSSGLGTPGTSVTWGMGNVVFNALPNTVTLTANTLTHLLFVYTAGHQTLYKNGVLVATGTSTPGNGTYITNAGVINASKFLTGSLGSVVAWKRALSLSDAQTLWNNGQGYRPI